MDDVNRNVIAQSLKDLDWKGVPLRNREALERAIAALECSELDAVPIPMLLFCPKCGLQHVDAAEPARVGESVWDKPPHRSHRCHACATVWRPADVPTVGVASIGTTGQADNWERVAHTVAVGAVRTVTVDEVEKNLLRKLLTFAWEVDIAWHRDRNEVRRIKLDLRDGVSMAPSLIEHRVDLIREFLATARHAVFAGGGDPDATPVKHRIKRSRHRSESAQA
ncbi:hypothetical protein [Paraburkholderia humisilvae]|uniref:Uncharacterized protein n=1 Tax=Paraburkholderia humisilvae TaxID=627669 RepID=A0A6J5DLQ8_9BURK|nr:hypothetical protein [Paraburkholderia humisilvae]CAB3753955.1 hypothetical protein LMG29542_02201 [Paraburkholderia humisilvae]